MDLIVAKTKSQSRTCGNKPEFILGDSSRAERTTNGFALVPAHQDRDQCQAAIIDNPPIATLNGHDLTGLNAHPHLGQVANMAETAYAQSGQLGLIGSPSGRPERLPPRPVTAPATKGKPEDKERQDGNSDGHGWCRMKESARAK